MPNDYVQTFYNPDRPAYLMVKTDLDQVVPAAPKTPIDTTGWTQPWTDAYRLASAPGYANVQLIAPGGFVTLSGSGITSAELIQIASTLQRRPLSDPGWTVTPPNGFVPFAESEGGVSQGPSHGLSWRGSDGSLVAELTINADQADVVVTAWGEPSQVATIDIDGHAGILTINGPRVAITWTIDGAEVLFGMIGDRLTAEAIVRGLVGVTEVDWLQASRPNNGSNDGCSSLFC
ncbi:MAG: hypothetical protein QM733_18735 [Ilumatobacteraceae bacterium]